MEKVLTTTNESVECKPLFHQYEMCWKQNSYKKNSCPRIKEILEKILEKNCNWSQEKKN